MRVGRADNLAGLDAIRGVSALYVALHHILLFGFSDDLAVHLQNGRLAWFFTHGPIMVDLFFILSGVVIAEVYGGRLKQKAEVGRYFMARIARLLPLHWAMLFALLMIVVFVDRGFRVDSRFVTDGNAGFVSASVCRFSPKAFALGLADLQGFLSCATWNYPSWSITFEVICYALFPFLYIKLLGVGRTGAFIALGLFVAAAALTSFGKSEGFLFKGAPDFVVPLLRALTGFGVGVCLFRLRALGEIRKSRAWNIVFVAVVLGFVAAMAAWRVPTAALILFLPLIVMSCLGATGWIINGLETPPLRLLGNLSYTIYLSHAVWELAAARIVSAVVPGGGLMSHSRVEDLLVISGASLFLVAASYPIWRFFEMPARSMIRSAYAAMTASDTQGSAFSRRRRRSVYAGRQAHLQAAARWSDREPRERGRDRHHHL